MVNKRAFLIAIFSVGAADAVAGSGPLIDGLEVGEDSVIEAGQKVTLKGENFGSAPGVVLWIQLAIKLHIKELMMEKLLHRGTFGGGRASL